MEQDKAGKLAETELEKAAGGGTQNRYDKQRCGNTKRTIYECVGFLAGTWCDHYSKHLVCKGEGYIGGRPPVYLHTCAMGCYSYEGYSGGDPK